jgi:hypothetical protein
MPRMGGDTERGAGLRRARQVFAAVVLCVCVQPVAPLAAQRSTYEELQDFSAVLRFVSLNYVDSVGYGPMVRAAISGALPRSTRTACT